jgi:RNA polymerase sigma factor (sigma-70 family)
MNRTLARLTRFAVDPARVTDGQLLDAFLGGRDGGAFEALVRRHGPMVLAVCRRVLRHHQDAEDAFQATFLVLARRAADVWPRDAVGSWLYGVAVRVALKARTTRARRTVKEQPLSEPLHPTANPQPDPDLLEAVDRAIRKLPEVYRAAVVACDLEGRSRKEAAEQLGWKEGTLSGRLARAREILAARLRRAGLTLPAGGVAAVFGTGATADAVSPGLLGRVAAFVGKNSAVGVPAPVAALTEGVVRTMFLTKLKAAAVAVLATGAIGFGAWASAGVGDGPGDTPGKGSPATPAKAAAKPTAPADLAEAQKSFQAAEHELMLMMFDSAGNMPPTDADDLRRRLDQMQGRLDAMKTQVEQARKQVPVAGDLQRMQGRWRIDKIVQKGEVLEVPNHQALFIDVVGDTMFNSDREGESQVEIGTFVLRPDNNPAQIDLRLKRRNETRPGIYRFTGPAEKLMLAVADGGPRPTAFEGTGKTVEWVELARVTDDKSRGAATPEDVRKRVERQKARLEELRQQLKEAERALEDETARAKSDAAAAEEKIAFDLKHLQGRWRIESIAEGAADRLTNPREPLVATISGHTLALPFRDASTGWRTTDYKFTLDPSNTPHGITLHAPGWLPLHGIYEFNHLSGRTLFGPDGHPVGLRLAVSSVAKPPAFGAGPGLIEFKLRRVAEEKPAADPKVAVARLKAAEVQVRQATADLEAAKVGVLQAQKQVEVATAKALRAEAVLAEAKKAAVDAAKKVKPNDQPVPPGKKATCTTHIRTLTAPENVISLDAGTDQLTVLDALTKAGDAVPLVRGPDALSVWVLRGKDVLPVDLNGIVNQGVTATNYVLRDGDRVFVQVKPAK